LNGVRLDESNAQQGQPQSPRPGGADAPRRPRASTGVKRPIPSRPDPETAARTAPGGGAVNGAGNGGPGNGGPVNGAGVNTAGVNGSAVNGTADGAAGGPADGAAPQAPVTEPAAAAAVRRSMRAAAQSAPEADKSESEREVPEAKLPEPKRREPERREPEHREPESSVPEGEDPDPFEEPEADAQQERPAPSRPRLDVVETVGRLLGGSDWERRASRGLAFLRRRITGDYEIDDFGFDRELTENVLLSMFRPLYERYFRVETRGIEHVPEKGGVLIVANHSGTLPLDAIMTQVALADHHPAHRSLRMLAADVVFTMPFIGELARKAGHTLACNPDAERLLCAGEVVGVWPEGFKGIGKPFADRYRLQRFGRGGFVSAALRTGTPIVPTAIVGAEEIYPKIGDIKPLARLLGLPYVPVTPTFPWLGPLGLIPLPSKWYIAFGEPIDTSSYDPGAADDPMLVFNLTDQVRETIQDTLYRLLLQRRSVFF
jgi:1-acyl-sn-glycerol-3-phosphate acyltransferase